MHHTKICTGVLCGLVVLGISIVAEADGHRRNRGRCIMTPSPQYEQACGSCHMAYPPMLLPAASWRQITPDSGEHFGDKLALDATQLREVQAYLEAHAADRTAAKRARKIMASLGGATPERISDVPYIIRKHRKIAPDVFKRPSVGGLSNCVSCHPSAARCAFDEDDVRIPD